MIAEIPFSVIDGGFTKKVVISYSEQCVPKIQKM
jgi:hypothetical protein